MTGETDLKFGGWTVNRVSGEMAREGRSSRLPQQPLRILVELYDHAGEIVTREQLVKTLWPTGIVDFDNGLNVAVRRLRVALDDVTEKPQYIETLPRVGYRFIGKDGAPPGSALQVVLHMSRRAQIALVLALSVLAVAIAGTWWWSLDQQRAQITAARAPPAPKHVPKERAREFYLEGLRNRSRRDINASSIAIENLKAALREDPDYAEAWAALADVYSGAVIRQMITPGEGVPEALAAARHAVALDDTLFQGHDALAEIYLDHERNFSAAHVELERARRLNDQSSRLWHHYAMWHAHQGQVEEALTDMRRARELEPTVPLYQSNYAIVLYSARHYDEAIAFLGPVVAANPTFDQARSILGRAMIAVGDLPGAREQFRLRQDPGVNQADEGYLAAKTGDRAGALREIERLEERGHKGFGVGYDVATIYVALGELDRGCEALARGVDDHSLLLAWMRLDPRMDALRGRQCFADVDKRVYGAPPTH